VKAFRDAVCHLGLKSRIIGIDSDPDAPAGFFCDSFHCVNPLQSKKFWSEIESICHIEKIGLAVPTRELELLEWSRWHENGGSRYCQMALSSRPCLQICSDKRHTHKWLLRHGFPSPDFISIQHLRKIPFQDRLPLVAKDPCGQGSRGVRCIRRTHEIDSLPDHWMAQPLLDGIEYTMNAYIDRTGKCRCLIPHRRLRVIDGEVDRARTEKISSLIHLGKAISEALPGAYGPINLQVFYKAENVSHQVTDINPRFGGGYPLAQAAGGRFCEWLLRESLGEDLTIRENDWQEHLMLLRYRESIFRRDAQETAVPAL